MPFSHCQEVAGCSRSIFQSDSSLFTPGSVRYRYHDMLPISNSVSLIHSSIAYFNDIFVFVIEFANYWYYLIVFVTPVHEVAIVRVLCS